MSNTNENEIYSHRESFIDKNRMNKILKETDELIYKTYPGEEVVDQIMDMMKEYLSEPYPIYTYRFFFNGWPDCTIVVYEKSNLNKIIGAIVGNVENKKEGRKKGYIAMLATDTNKRNKGIGKELINLLMKIFCEEYQVHEIYLETEIDNYAALHVYESFGFIRVKYYINYYLNGNSAFRLTLPKREFNKNDEKEQKDEE